MHTRSRTCCKILCSHFTVVPGNMFRIISMKIVTLENRHLSIGIFHILWDTYLKRQAWLQPNILGGVQLGAKHQEDSHTAPKALRQGWGGRAPMWGENFAFLEANNLTRKCLN